MKKTVSILLSLFFFLQSCNNDDDQPQNPIDLLPPASQVGANTFGCLLNGEVFLPDNLPNSTNCFYQFVNGEYYFLVNGSNYNENILQVVRLRTEKRQIFEGETYNLYEWEDGNATGNYTLNNIENYTTQLQTGELTITKLDFDNNIVSGTFFFDVEDNNGIVHQIREGRFDMQFTQ